NGFLRRLSGLLEQFTEQEMNHVCTLVEMYKQSLLDPNYPNPPTTADIENAIRYNSAGNVREVKVPTGPKGNWQWMPITVGRATQIRQWLVGPGNAGPQGHPGTWIDVNSPPAW
ncbi:MAG: hypothetical protein ACXADH_12775, partial [Candidatus Kariarchaeaceae archaeon]